MKQFLGQGATPTGNGKMSTQGMVQMGKKSIGQMPYGAGKCNPIMQTPKKMGGAFSMMGQSAYQTGSMQNKQGMQTAKSGSTYKQDLKDLIPSESY